MSKYFCNFLASEASLFIIRPHYGRLPTNYRWDFGADQTPMKKPVLDLLVVTVAILMWANTSPAVPVPDGGATASLFVVGVAGLTVARKFLR